MMNRAAHSECLPAVEFLNPHVMRSLLLTIGVMFFVVNNANGNEFQWSWGGEAGTFTTLEPGGAPGLYTVVDFAVTESALGGTIGSVSGGQYELGGLFATDPPLTFEWDGSTVTQWFHSGANTFDWHVYNDRNRGPRVAYVFAWTVANENDPTMAGYLDERGETDGLVTVTYEPAECYAIFSGGPGDATFTQGHEWETYLDPATSFSAVTLDDIASIQVPIPGQSLFSSPGIQTPWLMTFATQVLMYNPVAFPSNPEQYSSGLFVMVLPDFSLRTFWFGEEDGMQIYASLRTEPNGEVWVDIPFDIDGIDR